MKNEDIINNFSVIKSGNVNNVDGYFIECPGKSLHTTNNNDDDCFLGISDNNQIHLHCFHGSCESVIQSTKSELYNNEDIDEKIKRLKNKLFKKPSIKPFDVIVPPSTSTVRHGPMNITLPVGMDNGFKVILETFYKPEDAVMFFYVVRRTKADLSDKELEQYKNKEEWEMPLDFHRYEITATVKELLDKTNGDVRKLNQVCNIDVNYDGVYFMPNCLYAKGYPRKSNCIKEIKYVLIECDLLKEKSQQWGNFINSGIPFAWALDSGKKSIHFIVPVIASNNEDLKKLMKEVEKRLPHLLLDSKTADASRYSRMPGAFRQGKEQRLLAINGNQEHFKTLNEWIDNERMLDFKESGRFNCKSIGDMTPIDDSLNLINGRCFKRGQVWVLVARSNIGKSVLMTQQLMQWACGQKFAGMGPSKPLKCLLLSYENDEDTNRIIKQSVYDAFDYTDKQKKLCEENLRVIYNPEQFSEEQFLIWADMCIRLEKPDIVAIDTFFSMASQYDIMKPVGVTTVINGCLIPLSKKYKCGAMIVHHTNKGDDSQVSGPGPIIGSSTVMTYLEDLDVKNNYYQLRMFKEKFPFWIGLDGKPTATKILQRSEDYTKLYWTEGNKEEYDFQFAKGKYTDDKNSHKDLWNIIKENPGINVTGLKEKCKSIPNGKNKNNINDWLTSLEKHNLITNKGTKTKKQLFIVDGTTEESVII